MVRVKGFDVLLRAFAMADVPDEVCLVVGGDGPEMASLRDLAAELGLGARVILPGRLSKAAVLGAMTDAALVVVPSRREAFGIVVLEAWACGTPVVASRSGGPDDLIQDGDCGLLVDPEDPAAMAQAIGRALQPTLGQTLAAHGLRCVQHYTWRKTALGYLRLYGDRSAP
ncbi:N-acetyl-alpha-D-glucosaminyl L-malate synthase [bioreactor metagenome]|uniref:N-acetyl-alpha-D-glucosaminyl L-malate synthase n=1 Tax=bioreactor metagenome TaxID=1076179 RepID=A0A645HGI4_9ZZZZ